MKSEGRFSIGYAIYLLIVSISTLALVEFFSMKINLGDGIDLPYFFAPTDNYGTVRSGDKFNVIDPHLGYAYGEGESKLNELRNRWTWVDGFVVYKKQGQKIDRPVILALGGSTTDGVNFGHSWPEHLARILSEKGLPGTVLNGGTGGYSTNQELLKLIRDGLTFKPDIIISFSGVNDRGRYSTIPYHMVHAHQKEILDVIIHRHSTFMPNFVALAKRKLSNQNDAVSYTLGVKSDLSLAGQYERNITLMNSVAETYGADFYAFIQPNAKWNSRHGSQKGSSNSEYRQLINSLYKDIIHIPSRLKFCHDLTGIFEAHDGVYRPDGTHATDYGNKVIAEEIWMKIAPSYEKHKEASK